MTTDRPRILALFGGALLYGQERGNIEALAALKEQGCEILCLIRDEDWSTIISPALDARGLAWRKVPYVEQRLPGRMKYVLFRNPVAFIRANWRFMQIVREYQPTHIHAFNQLYVLNFLIGLILVRIPMIYRAGDEPTVHNWFWRALWRFVVWRTARFVANSRFISEALQAREVDKDRIEVIYSHPPMRKVERDLHANLLTKPGDFVVGYIGQLNQEKGPHLLVEACRQLAPRYPSVRLIISGRISDWSGDEWARSLRDKTLADTSLKERVTFTGYIENVPALMSSCSVIVVPSLWAEPLSNVVMEAKLVGRPSIVFPKGGLPEIIEHGVDGLVCSHASVAALIEALTTYLDAPELIVAHGLAARNSLRRFGMSKFGQIWLSAYAVAMRGAAQIDAN